MSFLYSCPPVFLSKNNKSNTMKKLISLTIILLCTLAAYAETAENRKENPHEIRIGITDDLFIRGIESPINPNLRIPNPQSGYFIQGSDEHNYRSTGHLFAEYQYRINHWLSIGGNFDVRTSLWQQTNYSVCPFETNTNTQNLHHVRLSLMPVARFTYHNSKYASLYASVGIGVQMQMFQNTIEAVYPTFDLCYFGVSLGKKHWYCDLELGVAPIPNILDRLFRFGVGYRF